MKIFSNLFVRSTFLKLLDSMKIGQHALLLKTWDAAGSATKMGSVRILVLSKNAINYCTFYIHVEEIQITKFVFRCTFSISFVCILYTYNSNS